MGVYKSKFTGSEIDARLERADELDHIPFEEGSGEYSVQNKEGIATGRGAVAIGMNAIASGLGAVSEHAASLSCQFTSTEGKFKIIATSVETFENYKLFFQNAKRLYKDGVMVTHATPEQIANIEFVSANEASLEILLTSDKDLTDGVWNLFSEASGEGSHQENGGTTIGKMTHAEGNETVAEGNFSHAEGSWTTAKGIQSHAEGVLTKAIGKQSHAEGAKTVARGNSSHAEGAGTQTNNSGEHAEGKYNKSNPTTQHSVGIGTSDTDRKNAFEIMQNGDAYLYGLGGYNGKNAGAENIKTLQEFLTTLNVSLFKVVDKLPAQPDAEDINKIFLVPSGEDEKQNIFAEYVWVNGQWEKFGDFDASMLDLSEYQEKVANTLQTDSKEIVGAINEIFNNFLAGSDLNYVDLTSSDASIRKEKLDEYRTKLTAKGIDVNSPHIMCARIPAIDNNATGFFSKIVFIYIAHAAFESETLYKEGRYLGFVYREAMLDNDCIPIFLEVSDGKLYSNSLSPVQNKVYIKNYDTNYGEDIYPFIPTLKQWATKLSSAAGAVKTVNLADGAVTLEKLSQAVQTTLGMVGANVREVKSGEDLFTLDDGLYILNGTNYIHYPTSPTFRADSVCILAVTHSNKRATMIGVDGETSNMFPMIANCNLEQKIWTKQSITTYFASKYEMNQKLNLSAYLTDAEVEAIWDNN